MLLAMARDVRVILIKLADRLHNMRTLDAVAPAQAPAHRARDARDLRADRQPPGPEHALPRAQDLVVQAPVSRRATACSRRRSRRRAATAARWSDQVLDAIREEACKDSELDAQVSGREKHVYSIYRRCARSTLVLAGARHLRLPRHRRPTCRRATSRSARCTGSTSRSPASSRTTSRSRRRTATSRCTPRCSARSARRSRSRSARTRCTDRRGGRRLALAVQGSADASTLASCSSKTHQWLQSLLEIQSESRRLGGVPRAHQGRPLPRRGLRLHAQGQDHGAAARRDRGRLRLRRAHRHRQPLRRGARSTTSWCRCAPSCKNGDRVEIITAAHAQAESGVAELRRAPARRARTSATS